MALVQAVVIALAALVITPGILFYFDVTPKLAILLAGTAAALLLARQRPGRSVFSILVLLSVISLSISTALSGNPALSLYGTNWRSYGALTQATILLFAWLGTAYAGRNTMLRAITASGFLTALYGIAQYFGWDPFLPAGAYHIGEGIWTIVRPPGTLGYVSYFATWLLLVIFLSLTLAIEETGNWWRRLAFVTAAAALVAMLFTGTRAALLGLLAGGAVWLYRRGFRSKRRVAALAAIVLIAGLAFYLSPAGLLLRSRTRWFSEDPWGGARLRLWSDSLRMAIGRWPAGYGPEVFTAAFSHLESTELAKAYPDFAHESPHNIFLDAFVAQGAPGLLLLVGFCAAGLAAAWRDKDPGLAATLAAGIVCQQFTVFTIPTALVLFTTVAMAVKGRGIPMSAGWRVLSGIAALALLYFGLRVTVAGHALAEAQNTLEAGNPGAAAAYYARYERWRLPGTAADLWYSRALIGFSQKTRNPVEQLQVLAQAGVAAGRATQTAEDPFNAWYNLGALYASQNNAAGAERCLRAAISTKPAWFKPHWTLARLLQLQHRMTEAEHEAALAAELNGGKNPEVARTWEEIRAQFQK